MKKQQEEEAAAEKADDKCSHGERCPHEDCDKIVAFCVIPDPGLDSDGKLETSKPRSRKHVRPAMNCF